MLIFTFRYIIIQHVVKNDITEYISYKFDNMGQTFLQTTENSYRLRVLF